MTYHWELRSPAGLVISMRLLSKYWTWRLPPGLCAYGSVRALSGCGPHTQVRLIDRLSTGWSVRVQTPRKASLLKPSAARAGAGGSASSGVMTAISMMAN